jgi:15-cis-phytoene synthase
LSEVAGAAYGAARNLCDLPLSLSRGHVPLPTADMASQDGLLQELRSGTVTPAIRVLLDRAASDVRDTLVRAKAGIVARPKAQIAAFLPLVMVEPYLKCVVARGRNPLRDIAEVMPITRVWRLARASWLRRV